MWALWQQAHRGAGAGPVPASYPLDLFPTINVGQTLSVTALGYQYAAATEMATFTANPLTVTLTAPAEPYRRADLVFHGVDYGGASYEGRLFVNHPDAGLETPTDDPSYVEH